MYRHRFRHPAVLCLRAHTSVHIDQFQTDSPVIFVLYMAKTSVGKRQRKNMRSFCVCEMLVKLGIMAYMGHHRVRASILFFSPPLFLSLRSIHLYIYI